MSKPKVGPEAIGNLFNKKKPKGGSSSTGKGKQQDIELGGETKPAAGARSPGGSSAVPLDTQISELLTKNGDLKDKSPEAVQKLTQILGRWEVNETTRLADLGSGTEQGSVLKYLKKSGNQEMYVSALAKSDGTLPTTALKKEYDTLVGGTQSKAPNESRPKVNNETVTHRPEKRPNRQYEKTTGNMDPNLPAYEKLQKIGNQMDGNAAADDDYLYALSQGYSPTKFDAELARIQAMTDPAERAEAINALSVNATKGMGRSSDLSTTSKFEQWLDQYLVKIDKPKTSGGGAKIGEGLRPGEKQQSLDFDGGGTAKSEGPDIDLGGKENSDTFEQKPEGTKAPEQTPEASQGGGGKDTPPPDAKTATGAPGKKPNNSRKVPPPGPDSPQHYAPRQPAPEEPNPILLRGEDGLGSSPLTKDEWEARVGKQDEPFRAAELKAKRNQKAGIAAAAGVAGSLAWSWLAGGDDEPDVPPSASTASIAGGPSTSTGSASGSVADASGGSSGGMSQEQMENLMKLQQIRDEQKRRFIGTGSGAQGVYR